VAPTVRSYSAEFEPLGLIARFPECYPGLLESGTPETHRSPDRPVTGAGRFDILPIANGEFLRLDPDLRLRGVRGPTGGGFLDALDAWWSELRLPASGSSLPFSGGWLVYLGYELANEIEPLLQLPGVSDAPVALALRTPAAWIRDRETQQAWLLAESGHEALLDRFEAQAKALRAAAPTAPDRPAAAPLAVDEEAPEKFLDAVRCALEYIAAGDIYQANLSRQWRGASNLRIDVESIYRRLRATNPSPFAALMRHGDFALMSSSPERLLSIRGGVASTRPIAGTRPRGATPDADASLVRSLLGNEKERAEHIMLIDLERNDLGRVCVGGTVAVDEYMSVESYAHVHHIVSNVSGRLRDDATPVQAIRALFPGGTITGCPKYRCMQIIAELEGVGRGAYTGSIGYLNRDGSCDFNILIRTISADAHSFGFRAGAGIVADSVAAQELAETRAKAQGLLRALEN
jgi:anthranilate synthase component 1